MSFHEAKDILNLSTARFLKPPLGDQFSLLIKSEYAKFKLAYKSISCLADKDAQLAYARLQSFPINMVDGKFVCAQLNPFYVKMAIKMLMAEMYKDN